MCPNCANHEHPRIQTSPASTRLTMCLGWTCWAQTMIDWIHLAGPARPAKIFPLSVFLRDCTHKVSSPEATWKKRRPTQNAGRGWHWQLSTNHQKMKPIGPLNPSQTPTTHHHHYIYIYMYIYMLGVHPKAYLFKQIVMNMSTTWAISNVIASITCL